MEDFFKAMESLGNRQETDIPERLVNEVIRSMRLDQAILLTENKILAEALAKFTIRLISAHGALLQKKCDC